MDGRTGAGLTERGGQPPKLSVVAPCYNEAEGLQAFYERTSTACRQAFGHDYEIVLVDDGSKDGTGQKISGLVGQDPNVVGVILSRNHGHQLALTAGLSVCRGERILVIDADLQDPPELLGDMLETMEAHGADVVYGQRRRRKGETLFKKTTAALFYRTLRRLVDIELPVDTGDFRLMSRRALDALLGMPESHRFVRGMVSWIGFKQVPFLYDRDERFAGETKYPLHKMLRLAADAITGFSIKPLRAASYLGMLFGMGGLLMLLYTLAMWSSGDVIRGWSSIMATVLILGSAQLFVIGVFGEYLGRLYMEAKRRPLFVIDRVLRSPAAPLGSHEPASHGVMA